MHSAGSDPRRHRRALCLAASLAALLIFHQPATTRGRATANEEVRALWVLRTSLLSPVSIAAMVESARSNGFNTLLVQVRGRGEAYFNGGIEPRSARLPAQPAGFDPLQETLAAAHRAGLRVHAWINVGLVAGARGLPPERDHLVYRHPEWLMVPRALAAELRGVDARSPRYLSRLAGWTGSNLDKVEGLYASMMHPAAADHAVALVTDLASRYDIDGLHLDYVRYPSEDFDYGPAALAEFRRHTGRALSAQERRRLDERARRAPLVYPEMFPERWAAFRRARLTSLVVRLRAALKTRRPEATLSAAVRPDPVEAFAHHLQDWRTWVEMGVLDAVCPMAYTQDDREFARLIAFAAELSLQSRVWAGIGAYRLPWRQTVDQIQLARRHSADGVVLFSYDSLKPDAAYLGRIHRAAFAADAPPAGVSR